MNVDNTLRSMNLITRVDFSSWQLKIIENPEQKNKNQTLYCSNFIQKSSKKREAKKLKAATKTFLQKTYLKHSYHMMREYFNDALLVKFT